MLQSLRLHGLGQLTRRPTKVAAIALANKIARMAWAMMAKGERYKEPAALAA
jgi:transposase